MAADLSRYLTYYSHRPDNVPQLSPEECRVIPWFAIGGDKKFRYTYPLTKDSIAYDMGGYEGEWADKINKKYGCTVEVFEPVGKFADNLRKLFAGRDKIHVYDFGLGGSDHTEKINLDLASSSAFKKGGKTETIHIKRARDFINKQKSQKIDLIKINIEGGEYELLDDLIKSGLIKNITDLQLQFHNFVPKAVQKRADLQERLNKTHYLTFCYPWIWENWRRR
jgi:FkbM family methyltransferase